MGLGPMDNPSILADSVNSAGHFFVFGLLALLLAVAAALVLPPHKTPGWLPLATGFVLAVGAGLLLELVQRLIPGRNSSLSDLWQDTLGALAGICLLRLLHFPRSDRSAAWRPLDEPGIAGQRHDSGLPAGELSGRLPRSRSSVSTAGGLPCVLAAAFSEIGRSRAIDRHDTSASMASRRRQERGPPADRHRHTLCRLGDEEPYPNGPRKRIWCLTCILCLMKPCRWRCESTMPNTTTITTTDSIAR